MTGRTSTLSMDGTPISHADIARMETEEKLHAERRRRAARVVAAASLDADDCRMLLDVLGLDQDVVAAARTEALLVPATLEATAAGATGATATAGAGAAPTVAA